MLREAMEQSGRTSACSPPSLPKASFRCLCLHISGPDVPVLQHLLPTLTLLGHEVARGSDLHRAVREKATSQR